MNGRSSPVGKPAGQTRGSQNRDPRYGLNPSQELPPAGEDRSTSFRRATSKLPAQETVVLVRRSVRTGCFRYQASRRRSRCRGWRRGKLLKGRRIKFWKIRDSATHAPEFGLCPHRVPPGRDSGGPSVNQHASPGSKRCHHERERRQHQDGGVRVRVQGVRQPKNVFDEMSERYAQPRSGGPWPSRGDPRRLRLWLWQRAA